MGNVTIHPIPAAVASPSLIGAAYIGASPIGIWRWCR